MFTAKRECHMPSISGRLSYALSIVLMITGLQTIFLQIFYVHMSRCQNGMELGGGYGLILSSQNFWPWIEILPMDVNFKIFVVIIPDSYFD